MPHGHVANWVMGNHDNPRVASRFGEKSVDAMNMLLMTLPGIAITYNVCIETSTFQVYYSICFIFITSG